MSEHEPRHDELLAAHAAGALDGDDLRELERHLAAGCARCEAELPAWREAVLLVAEPVPEVAPSEATRARTLAAIRREPRAPARSAATPRGRFPWRSIAAALLVVAVGLLGAVVVRQQGRLAELDQRASELGEERRRLEERVAELESEGEARRQALAALEQAAGEPVAAVVAERLQALEGRSARIAGELAALADRDAELAARMEELAAPLGAHGERLATLEERQERLATGLGELGAALAGIAGDSRAVRLAVLLSGAGGRSYELAAQEGRLEGAVARVLAADELDRAILVASGLVPQGDELDYQLWAIAADGAKRSVEVFDADPASSVLLAFERDAIEGAAALGVTVEPAGGAEQPNLERLVLLGALEG